MYFATPEKLDNKQPFVDKRVRQAMNMAINRPAIATSILGGKAQPMRVTRFHPKADEVLWPGIWNPDWDKRAEDLYGYNPVKAKRSWRRRGMRTALSSPSICIPCLACRRSSISGRHWRSTGRQLGSSRS